MEHCSLDDSHVLFLHMFSELNLVTSTNQNKYYKRDIYVKKLFQEK
jgi:hypothetical protein